MVNQCRQMMINFHILQTQQRGEMQVKCFSISSKNANLRLFGSGKQIGVSMLTQRERRASVQLISIHWNSPKEHQSAHGAPLERCSREIVTWLSYWIGIESCHRRKGGHCTVTSGAHPNENTRALLSEQKWSRPSQPIIQWNHFIHKIKDETIPSKHIFKQKHVKSSLRSYLNINCYLYLFTYF